MTTKTYGIYGRSTAIIRVPVGRGGAFMEVEFNRGIPTPGPNYRPATFSTSDPVTQAILERCDFFGKLYKIYRIRHEGDDEPSLDGKAAETPAAPVHFEEIEGVTTREEAIEYLKQRGAKASDLRTNAAIRKYMEKIEVTFPNVEI